MDLATLRKVYAGIKRHAAGSWAIFDPSRIVLGGEPGDDSDEPPDPRVGIGLLVEGGLLERHPNAPVTWILTPNPDHDAASGELVEEDVSIWNRLRDWARLDEVRGRPFTFQTAEACEALGVPPESLARTLDTQPDWNAQEGNRLPCLELFPVEASAAARLQQVLDAAANRARDRVNRTMIYAEGRRCRHAELAAHLGERLPACGNACDVCTGEAASASAPRASRERQPRKRSTTTSADALLALKALASAPFPVGKTGLTRLLEGSIQSRIQGDRSPYFGALGDLQKSKIDAVIDSLVADEALVYDRSREFPVLRITEEGALRLRNSSGDD
jgi:ATP-dependent DNA helicase RecQ